MQSPVSTWAPMVSVVVPVYNRAILVGRAVRSVLAQTYQRFEVIVVDDGSADADLVELELAKLKDARIVFIRLPANRGAGAARNVGAKRAVGEFLGFLDSDDEWLPDKLSSQLQEFRRAGSMSSGLLVSCRVDARTVNGEMQVWPKQLKCAAISVGDYLFVHGGFLQTSSFLMRRMDFLKIGFREDLARHQDFDLLLRWEIAGFRIRMLEEVLMILHWEDQHVRLRSAPAMVTLKLFREYKEYLSEKARSNFLYVHWFKRFWMGDGPVELGNCCVGERFSFADLVLQNKIDYVSRLFFRDSRLLGWMVSVKSLFRGIWYR